VLDTPRRYVCRNGLGDEPACDFRIGRQILNRPLDAGEVRQLLGQGKTDLLQGFVSKKNRRKFAAHLTIDSGSGKLGFEFAPRKNEVNGGAKNKRFATKKAARSSGV